MSETFADRAPEKLDPKEWVRWAGAAAALENWELAVERWTRCISQFGGNPRWRAKLGDALLKLGHIEQAKAEFASVAREMPDIPLGLTKLAAIAGQQGDWEEAQSLWAECIGRYPDGKVTGWSLNRANALQNLGRKTEADALLSRSQRQHRQDRIAQFDQAVQKARHDKNSESCGELLREIQQISAETTSDEDLVRGVYWSIALGGDETAIALLDKCIELAGSLHILRRCFQAIPRCVERGRQGALWDRILNRLRAHRSTSSAADIEGVELELCVLLAMERFSEFVHVFEHRRQQMETSMRRVQFDRIRQRLVKPCDEVFAERKVFGIGLSRTATSSLNEALNILGIDAAHWSNPLTGQIIGGIDAFLFGGCTDTSISSDFERLYHTYPNAVFIWTQRPQDAWLRSFQAYKSTADWGKDSLQRRALELDGGSRKFPLNQIHQGLYWSQPTLGAAYKAFEVRVRNFFADKPVNKLLEFNVFAGQGWAELCAFLHVPVPDSAFPWANKGQ